MFNEIMNNYIDNTRIKMIGPCYFSNNDFQCTGLRHIINDHFQEVSITIWFKMINDYKHSVFRITDHYEHSEYIYYVEINEYIIEHIGFYAYVLKEIQVVDNVDEYLKTIMDCISNKFNFKNIYNLV